MTKPIDVAEFVAQLGDDDLIAAELHEASIEHVNARIIARQVIREVTEQRESMDGLISDALNELECLPGDGLDEQGLRAAAEAVLRNLAEDSVCFSDMHRESVAKIRRRLRELDGGA